MINLLKKKSHKKWNKSKVSQAESYLRDSYSNCWSIGFTCFLLTGILVVSTNISFCVTYKETKQISYTAACNTLYLPSLNHLHPLFWLWKMQISDILIFSMQKCSDKQKASLTEFQ